MQTIRSHCAKKIARGKSECACCPLLQPYCHDCDTVCDRVYDTVHDRVCDMTLGNLGYPTQSFQKLWTRRIGHCAEKNGERQKWVCFLSLATVLWTWCLIGHFSKIPRLFGNPLYLEVVFSLFPNSSFFLFLFFFLLWKARWFLEYLQQTCNIQCRNSTYLPSFFGPKSLREEGREWWSFQTCVLYDPHAQQPQLNKANTNTTYLLLVHADQQKRQEHGGCWSQNLWVSRLKFSRCRPCNNPVHQAHLLLPVAIF